MNALQVTKPGECSIIELNRPKIERGEVIIKVLRLGLCGSDLSTWNGINPMVSYPRVVGHEVSGVIEEIGDDVPENIKVGASVTVIPYTSCGVCSSCRAGRVNACINNQTLGVQRNGACAEYISVPWQKVVISDTLTFDELVLVEPLSVGFHAAKRGRVKSDDIVAVIGCGMIGLGAIAGAAAISNSVIAIDISDSKLDLSRKMGAAYTINSDRESLHQKLSEITNGDGPGLIIEAVGSPLTFQAAVDEVAYAGRVVYIGYAKSNVEYETRLFVMKELDIMGSRNAIIEDFNHVIEVIKSGEIPVDRLITKRFTLENSEKALEYWSKNTSDVTKIVIDFE